MRNDDPNMLEGWYGSFAFRLPDRRWLWKCYDSSDYSYYAVVDDFGDLVPVSQFTNLRGY
jgi:hypothetical protein